MDSNSGNPIATVQTGQSSAIDLSSAGAHYTVKSMSRRSDAYLINDNELESLSDIATHNAAGWSLATLAGTQVIAAIWDMGFSTGNARFGGGWLVFWGIVGVAAVVYTTCRGWRRSALINRIKQESSPSTGPLGR